jgi:tetratricopeptide (TPR) repeat protein
MALGRAYLGKEMRDEAREALQRVVTFTPENMLAQKLLCQIYMDSGEDALLRRTLETLLSLNAADAESRLLLDSLDRISTPDSVDQNEIESPYPSSSAVVLEFDTTNNCIEELEEIDLLDELEEMDVDSSPSIEKAFQATNFQKVTDNADSNALADSPFGIRTATIADLYAAQGHHEQALDIYRELQKIAPENPEYESRIEEITESIPGSDDLSVSLEDPWSPLQRAPVQLHDMFEEPGSVSSDLVLAAVDKSEELSTILQEWLDNIRRLRACRSVKN